MRIERYKGVEIHHDAMKDEFYTQIVINKREGKRDEVIKGTRLQSVRDSIDKFLNTAAKKPIIQKAWLISKNDNEKYEPVDIILINLISGDIQVRKKDGKMEVVEKKSYYGPRLFLSCKENDAMVKALQQKLDQIEKIRKEFSCTSGKLIPLKEEHFM
jgi:hypothetical protein